MTALNTLPQVYADLPDSDGLDEFVESRPRCRNCGGRATPRGDVRTAAGAWLCEGCGAEDD